jgi:hypothetical protein
VDKSELKEITFSLHHDTVNRSELSHLLSNQLKPMLLSISSLEKTTNLIEAAAKDQYQHLSQEVQSLQRYIEKDVKSNPLFSMNMMINRSNPLYSTVEELTKTILLSSEGGILHQSRRDSNLMMEKHFLEEREYLLKQLSIQNESMRLELLTNIREDNENYKAIVLNQLSQTKQLISEVR